MQNRAFVTAQAVGFRGKTTTLMLVQRITTAEGRTEAAKFPATIMTTQGSIEKGLRMHSERAMERNGKVAVLEKSLP
jgi:hypothetical protein